MAQENGAQKFVLSDINNTSACLDFVRLAPKYGIEPVLGIDFRNRAIQQFVGIAKNNKGFEVLNEYLSEFLHLNVFSQESIHYGAVCPLEPGRPKIELLQAWIASGFERLYSNVVQK